MNAESTSRHQEWLESLEPRVRAEVEAEIAYYKPNGVWQFEEVDDDEGDWVPQAEPDTAAQAESDSDVVAAAD